MRNLRDAVIVVVAFLAVMAIPVPSSRAQNACMEGDTNHDGKVSLVDFETWRKIFKGDPQTPTIQPTTQPSPTPNPASPSGEAMPVGNLPGFTQIFTDDFTTPVPLGSFPGTNYTAKWSVYPDGKIDTAGGAGNPSVHMPSKVISVSGGLLKYNLHQEGGQNLVAAALPKYGDRAYGKYTIRYRVPNQATGVGFKQEWVLWPESDNFPNDGAFNIETEFGSNITGKVIYMQPPGTLPDRDVHQTGINTTGWHTASIEWKPGRAEFFIDGVSKGVSTTKISNKPMHWVVQTASCAASCPAPGTSANVEIDWIAVYSYTP